MIPAKEGTSPVGSCESLWPELTPFNRRADSESGDDHPLQGSTPSGTNIRVRSLKFVLSGLVFWPNL